MALRLPKKRKTRLLLGGLLAFFLLAAFLVAVPFMPERIKTTLMPPKVHPKSAWYVALGDSYTAAPALKRQLAVSTPGECFQSDANYPHIVARAIKARSLTDVSCSGAFTRHLTGPQWTKDGSNAPQADALSDQTRLVTIGLSGNDSMLFPLFFECAGKPHDPANPSYCVKKFRSGGQDRFLAAAKSVAPKIGEMLDVVYQRAPRATVYVVGYPQITPNDGTDCPDEMPFTAADLAYLDSGMRQLNSELRSAARVRGMHYVDSYTPSRGLGVCAPRDRRWVESVVPTAPAFAMHPNPVGEMGIAEAVLKAIERVARAGGGT
jgi:hypothetical protein